MREVVQGRNRSGRVIRTKWPIFLGGPMGSSRECEADTVVGVHGREASGMLGVGESGEWCREGVVVGLVVQGGQFLSLLSLADPGRGAAEASSVSESWACQATFARLPCHPPECQPFAQPCEVGSH